MSMLIMPAKIAPSKILLVPPKPARKSVNPVFNAPIMGFTKHIKAPMNRTPSTG